MKFKKTYGQSKIDTCPFCDKRAVTENKQGVPTCLADKDKFLDLKCPCGSWLDIKKGKFGPFCTCIKCGNINLNKALSFNKDLKNHTQEKTETKEFSPEKTTVVTSDEVDFLY